MVVVVALLALTGAVFFLRRFPCSSVSSTRAMSRMDAFDGMVGGAVENSMMDGDVKYSFVMADDAIIVDGDAVSCVDGTAAAAAVDDDDDDDAAVESVSKVAVIAATDVMSAGIVRRSISLLRRRSLSCIIDASLFMSAVPHGSTMVAESGL